MGFYKIPDFRIEPPRRAKSVDTMLWTTYAAKSMLVVDQGKNKRVV